MKNCKKDNFFSFIIFAAGTVLLFCFAILSLIHPDQKRSETENRALLQYTDPGIQSVLDGSWEKDYEAYSLDQFVFRDHALHGYFFLADIARVNARNGYVRGKNDSILEIPEIREKDTAAGKYKKKYAKNRVAVLDKLKAVCDSKGTELIYLSIPHKSLWQKDLYPKYYPFPEHRETQKQTYLLEQIEKHGIAAVDAAEVLNKHKEEYLYFNTDNHFTFRGAYYTYLELLHYINKTYHEELIFPEWNTCEYVKERKRFVGGYLRTYGDSGMISSDYLEYITPKDMPAYERYENGKASDLPLLDMNRNEYERFMSGNNANTMISTDREELPNILFIGYSYTNALEYLAIYSFNEMHSIDPRHYKGSISDYIAEHDIDYVVVVRDDLYEGNSFNKASIE